MDDFWDENADYVGVDGTLIKGRAQMQAFFRKMAESSTGHQTASVEQIRFITRELATADGSWTVTGARSADEKELAPIKGTLGGVSGDFLGGDGKAEGTKVRGAGIWPEAVPRKMSGRKRLAY